LELVRRVRILFSGRRGKGVAVGGKKLAEKGRNRPF